MLNRLLDHIRHSIVGYIALFIAMGGSGYAAINLPAASVGNNQLRNHSITPVKFNRQLINGNIRAWVVVNANGSVQAGAGKPTVQLGTGPGTYFVRWKSVATPTQRGCFPITGVTSGFGPGFTTQVFHAASPPHHPGGVFIDTFDAQGQPLAESFYAALVC